MIPSNFSSIERVIWSAEESLWFWCKWATLPTTTAVEAYATEVEEVD